MLQLPERGLRAPITQGIKNRNLGLSKNKTKMPGFLIIL